MVHDGVSLTSFAAIVICLSLGTATKAHGQTGSLSPPAANAMRLDLHGDPLPDGALFRLGTIRFRNYLYSCRQELADGQTTLIGTPREIRWVDSQTGRQIKAVPIKKGLKPAGFSADGRLAVLTDFTDVYLFDLIDAKILRKFPPNKEKARNALAHFSPDNRIVAITTWYTYAWPIIRTMDVDQGTELWELGDTKGQDQFDVLGFAAGEKGVVVRCFNGNRVSVRDWRTGRELRSFETRPNNTRLKGGSNWAGGTCRLSPDQRFVGFVAFRFPFEIRDFGTGKLAYTFEHKSRYGSEYAWSPDLKTFVNLDDATLLIRDWPSGKIRLKTSVKSTTDPSQLRDMRVSGDGRRVEMSTGLSMVRVDLNTGKQIDSGASEAHSHVVHGVAIAADGKIVTLGGDKSFRVWDPKTGRQAQSHHIGGWGYPGLLTLNADGRLVAFFERNGVSVYERDSGKLVEALKTGSNSVISLDFDTHAPILRVRTTGVPVMGAPIPRPGGGFAAGPVFTEWSQLDWNFERDKIAKRSKPIAGDQAVVSRDGHLAACFGLNERIIRIVDMDAGRVLRSFPDADQVFQTLTFSPDGRGLIVNGNRRFTLWELSSLKERWRVEFPKTWSPDPLSISGDGRWIARVDGDNQIHLYDARSGKRVHSFIGHDSRISSIAFAPDLKTLVSSSEDTTALVWDLKGVLDRLPAAAIPDAKAIEQAWKDLANSDAALAYRALGRLMDGGDASVALLGKQLQPAKPLDPERVQKLLTDLSRETFVVRERAMAELKKNGGLDEAMLERYLAQTKSLEAKRRVTQLLERIRGPIADPQQLQSLRAIEALEGIGTPSARRVLESLSAGTSGALLTMDAKRSAERLAQRLGRR